MLSLHPGGVVFGKLQVPINQLAGGHVLGDAQDRVQFLGLFALGIVRASDVGRFTRHGVDFIRLDGCQGF